MGQEESIPQEPHSARNYQIQSKGSYRQAQRLEHEGILRLRSTPFPDCVEIDNDGFPLFLENAQMTLHDLLQSRLYTNRLFPCEDIERLLQNTVYTLAFMEDAGVIYKDLSPHNIYYNNGHFKLLPNELIESSLFERAYENFYSHKANKSVSGEEFVCLSPELVIALRMRERHIDDQEILNKANVFLLGLILLEATTLMPSSQCFDLVNYDIFNVVVTERLELVQEHYNERIARIISNMIDYDYSERMNLKDLAIWLNRQMASTDNQNRLNSHPSYSKFSSSNSNMRGKNSAHNQCEPVAPQLEQPESDEEESEPEPVKRTYSRTNMIYINGYDDGFKEEMSSYHEGVGFKGARNSIYLRPAEEIEPQYNYGQEQPQQNQRIQQPDYRRHYLETEKQSRGGSELYQKYKQQNKKIRNDYLEPDINTDQSYGRLKNHHRKISPYEQDSYKPQKLPSPHYLQAKPYSFNDAIKDEEEGPTNHINQFRDIGNIGGFKQQEQPFADLKPYKYDRQSQTAKGTRPVQNKYFPSLSEIENQQLQITKRLAKHSEVKGSRVSLHSKKEDFQSQQSRQSQSKGSFSMNDGSINRIKMQVQKSRKMIEEFRKSEGLTN